MFNQETLDRLTVRDIRELERVMEVMAKFRITLPRVIMSLGAVGRTTDHWRYDGTDDFEEALEQYNTIAEGDGFSWTPPSER